MALNIPLELEGALRLFLSLICGALVGLDRERGHRPAGLRTHTLVCMGACLVMYTSIWATTQCGFSGDPMRMSAQVISGIGFLGAGTIIKAGHDVRGLTTAACLWTVACVGLAVGAGYYIGAICVTLFVLLTLNAFKKLELRLEAGHGTVHLRVDTSGATVEDIYAALAALDVQVLSLAIHREGEDRLLKLQVLRPHKVKPQAVLATLSTLEGVRSVSEQEGA